MNNENQKVFESINRKMNVLISLMMLLQSDNEFTTDVDKISKLKEWGLENEEIGQLLGKTTIQISKQLYKSKKRSKIK